MNRTQIIKDIADRALGGYEPEIDGTDIQKVARWFVAWYSSPDAPEPINHKDYQIVLFEEPEMVYRAIYKALALSFA